MVRYVREFHDPAAARGLAATIERITSRSVNLMEVCGTHTVAIFRHGIRDLLPPPLSMLSGPGCPVCVTTNADIDKAIALAEQPGVTLATFGDMMKVPGSYQSLQQVKADGSDVRVVYSPRDAVCMARDNPQRPVIFLTSSSDYSRCGRLCHHTCDTYPPNSALIWPQVVGWVALAPPRTPMIRYRAMLS